MVLDVSKLRGWRAPPTDGDGVNIGNEAAKESERLRAETWSVFGEGEDWFAGRVLWLWAQSWEEPRLAIACTEDGREFEWIYTDGTVVGTTGEEFPTHCSKPVPPINQTFENSRKDTLSRPSVIACSVFGGRSPKTGLAVGERHRWGGGAWGVGRCDFCGRYLADVLEKPKTELSLDHTIELGKAVGDEGLWRPSYHPGGQGSTKGWYIKRGPAWRPEWFKNADEEVVRFDSEEQAKLACDAANAAGEEQRRNYAFIADYDNIAGDGWFRSGEGAVCTLWRGSQR